MVKVYISHQLTISRWRRRAWCHTRSPSRIMWSGGQYISVRTFSAAFAWFLSTLLFLKLAVGQRVASHYSAKERVFIAGDACAPHPYAKILFRSLIIHEQVIPTLRRQDRVTKNLLLCLKQRWYCIGMNASMNDTHNLAWKLVHVLRGWANQSILKTVSLRRVRPLHISPDWLFIAVRGRTKTVRSGLDRFR